MIYILRDIYDGGIEYLVNALDIQEVSEKISKKENREYTVKNDEIIFSYNGREFGYDCIPVYFDGGEVYSV